MSEHRDIDDRLLARHLWGDVTEEEQALLTGWVESAPNRQAALDALRDASRRAAELPTPAHVPDADGVWRAIAAETTQSVRTRRAWPAGWLVGRRVSMGRVAAAMILLVGIFGWRMIATAPAPNASNTPREFATARGQRADLHLTDGTHVILAPESRLRLPAAFNTATGLGSRDLELDGEAYFEVKHDTARPFRVRTIIGTAEDLGTEFVVTAYPEAHTMRVLVASGEVAMHNAILRSGDLAQLDIAGTMHVARGVDPRLYLAWTSGKLVFAKTPMPDVQATVLRWYGVDIRLADPALATRTVTMAFDKTSVQRVVELLELLLNARAEWNGPVVTLFARPRQDATNRTAVTPHGGTGIP